MVPRFAILSFALLCFLGWMFAAKTTLELPPLPVTLLLMAFYVLNLASAGWALNVADALFETQKIFSGLLLIVVFYNLMQHPVGQKATVRVILLCAMGAVTIGYFAFFQKNTMGAEMVQSTLFGHKNLLSSFLFLALPFAFENARKIGGTQKLLPIVLIVLIGGLLFLLKTRSVWLALVIAMAFYSFAFWSICWPAKLRKWVVAGFATVILLGGFLAINYVKNATENTPISTQTASLAERFKLWEKTAKVIQENPIVGVGAGNWQYNYTKFGVNDIAKTRMYGVSFKRPHNDFLWILAENGTVGFVLFLGIALLIGRMAWGQIIQEKNVAVLTYTSALVGLLVISFFSFPKERIPHICLAAIMLAMVIKGYRGFTLSVKLKKQWLGAVVLPLLVLNCWLGYKRIQGEYYTNKAIVAQQNLNANAAIENSEKAASFFYTCDPTGTPITTYAGWGYNLKTDLKNLVTVNAVSYALAPHNYKVVTNNGYALLRAGFFKEAKILFELSHQIHTSYEPTLLNLSVVEFNLGHYDTAYNWLQKIPNYQHKYPTNINRIKERL